MGIQDRRQVLGYRGIGICHVVRRRGVRDPSLSVCMYYSCYVLDVTCTLSCI